MLEGTNNHMMIKCFKISGRMFNQNLQNQKPWVHLNVKSMVKDLDPGFLTFFLFPPFLDAIFYFPLLTLSPFFLS